MNGRKVLNLDKARSGEVRWLPCCWDECERDGVTLHRARFHDHPRTIACDAPDSKHVWYVFCSERHRQYFLHSHHAYGRLPAGMRGLVS